MEPTEQQAYEMNLPQDENALRFSAAFSAVSMSILHWPDDVIRDADRLEAWARAALVVVHRQNPRMTNDFAAYANIYVTQFVQSYLTQTVRYDADASTAKEDKAQLEAVDQANAWQELLQVVQRHLQDELQASSQTEYTVDANVVR